MHGEVGVVLVGGRAGEIKITKKDPGSIGWGDRERSSEKKCVLSAEGA